MHTRHLITQLQTQILLLAAAGLKEYEADWLKNTDKVVRDATGRFASKATSVVQQTKEKAEGALNETQDKVTSFKQAAENIAKDPKEAKRRVNSKLLDLTGKGLDKLIEKNPEFADQLTSKMFGVDAQKARDRVSQMYEDINPKLAEEVKKDPFQELADNLKAGKLKREDLDAAFEYAGQKYNKLIDDLNNMEGQSDEVKALGKAAAASIPVVTFLAATLAPEVTIGLLVGEGLETMLASAVVGQVASGVANEAMDKMEVDSPTLRLGVNLAVGIGAGLAVSAPAKFIRQAHELEASKGLVVEAIQQVERDSVRQIKIIENTPHLGEKQKQEKIQQILDYVKNLQKNHVELMQSKNMDQLRKLVMRISGDAGEFANNQF